MKRFALLIMLILFAAGATVQASTFCEAIKDVATCGPSGSLR